MRESVGSDTFRFTCKDCGAVYRVTATTGFGAARTASTRAGWTFTRVDRCKRCTRLAQGALDKPAATRGKAKASRKA